MPYTYNWEYDDGTGNGFQPITNTSDTYSPSALSDLTLYQVTYESSLGCGSFLSNTISVNVLPEINQGSIISDQTLCYNTTALDLGFDVIPSGAAGYDYQWQENNNGWSDLINEITDTYNPGVNSVGTHEFRLEVTSSHNSNCISKYTNPVTITVLPEFTTQFITQDQNICYNTLPNQLEVNANGADDNFTYQWYKKDNGNQYATILNATSETYNETNELLDSTLYMVEVTSTFGCGTLTQSDLSVNVADTFQGNLQALSTVDTICYNTIPDIIQTISDPGGGYIPYTYTWEYNNNGPSGWQSATNSNTDSYPADELTTTTSYRVTYTSSNGCGSYTSNSSVINVLSEIDPGSILDNDTICYESDASTLLIETDPIGWNNEFIYQWQLWNGTNWDDILDSISTSYDPGILLASNSFRLEVTSGYAMNCISRYTDSIYIHVWDLLDPGIISEPTVVCYDISPSDIVNTLSEGVDGDFSYTWYSSLDNQNFSIVNGADSTLPLPALQDTTYYYLDVTSDFGCGTLSTNTVMAAVYGEFLIGTISDNDTICSGDFPDNILTDIPTIGANGVYDYEWQWSMNGTYTTIPGSLNDATWMSTALDSSVTIQLVVSNAVCGDSELTNTVDIIVNPLPIEYAIEGLLGLTACANQSNAVYTLETTPSNYSYNWSTSIGNIVGTTQSNDCMINWPNIPNTTANLQVTVTIYEPGSACSITTNTSVTLSDNVAPDVVDVILKPNSTILACNDSTPGIHYQWGYDVIATGVSNDLVGDTLQYVQLASVPDTNIERYWVDTYYNYANGVSCITRSYYNAPPLPLDVFEVNASNFMIFPNPVTDVLNFNYESDEKIVIQVLDLLGRNVECDIDYSNNKILFNNIKPSIYMLVVKSNKNEFIKKFIIK